MRQALSVPAPSPSPFRTQDQKATDREAKRHALLLAAARMFSARGFHASSLDDVAASVGVTKPTVYHYLGNKEQVLLECMAIGLAQLEQAAERARAEPGRGIDRLRAFLLSYSAVNLSEFGLCVIRTGDELLSPEGQERLRGMKRPIDEALRGFIEAGIADGSIAPCDVRMMAFALAGALNWAGRWYDPAGPQTPTDLARRLVAGLESGFAPR